MMQKMSDKEMYVIELRKRIDTYFHIVIRNIRDQIPKIIGFFLVKGSQDKLQFELYSKLVSYPGVLNTIGEAPIIAEERSTLQKAQSTLESSLKVMKRSLESVGMDEDEEEIFYEIEKAKKEMDSKKDKKKDKRSVTEENRVEHVMSPATKEKESEKLTQELKDTSVVQNSSSTEFKQEIKQITKGTK